MVTMNIVCVHGGYNNHESVGHFLVETASWALVLCPDTPHVLSNISCHKGWGQS